MKMTGKQKLNLDKVKAEIKIAIQKKTRVADKTKKQKTKQDNRELRQALHIAFVMKRMR